MSDHKQYRCRHVRLFMESDGYQETRKGNQEGPIFVQTLGEGRGKLISAKERKSDGCS